MKAFIKTFERVTLKYAKYVEAKLTFSTNIVTPIKPGQEISLVESKETAEEYIKEIQTLCQIAETLQNLKTDMFGIDEEELDNLQPTDAELEAFRKTIVCYMNGDAKTRALEITPVGDKGKIILANEGQIKAFLYVVRSFLR